MTHYLAVNQLTKSFSIEILFENITFTVNPGERIGLVGPNGCGKSTLLKIIIGQEKPTSGSIRFSPSNLRIGYLAQGLSFTPVDTLGSFVDRMTGDIHKLSKRLEELAVILANQPSYAVYQDEYDDTLSRLALADQSVGMVTDTLAALGLNNLDPELPVAALSGGQKTRLALAGILLSQPQLLLLDEPTNHLDLDMLVWLENWLVQFPFAALIVSHDRTFLDHTTTAIIEIDPLTHTSKRYEGNYTFYLEQKIAEREKQWQTYKDQQDEIAQLKAAAARVRSRAVFRKGGKGDAENTDGFTQGHFANRTKETVARAKHIEHRIERLLNEDHIEKPGRTWQMKIDFKDIMSSGRDVLLMENAAVGYGNKELVTNINGIIRFGQRLALVGPNGAGKTTLLRTIAGQIPILSGQIRLGANVKLGYMAQEQENLDGNLTPLETVSRIFSQSETEQRAFLSKFLFRGDDVFIPVQKLSYGERSRLTLACMVAQGCNFLLLDEPINHLDIPSRAQFEQALTSFDGTVMAVVHDRYFLNSFATRIWEIREGHMREIYQIGDPTNPSDNQSG